MFPSRGESIYIIRQDIFAVGVECYVLQMSVGELRIFVFCIILQLLSLLLVVLIVAYFILYIDIK